MLACRSSVDGRWAPRFERTSVSSKDPELDGGGTKKPLGRKEATTGHSYLSSNGMRNLVAGGFVTWEGGSHLTPTPSSTNSVRKKGVTHSVRKAAVLHGQVILSKKDPGLISGR